MYKNIKSYFLDMRLPSFPLLPGPVSDLEKTSYEHYLINVRPNISLILTGKNSIIERNGYSIVSAEFVPLNDGSCDASISLHKQLDNRTVEELKTAWYRVYKLL